MSFEREDVKSFVVSYFRKLGYFVCYSYEKYLEYRTNIDIYFYK